MAECVTGFEEPMICGAFSASAAVFLADVQEARVVPNAGIYEVRFRVLNAYKGIKPGEQTLRFIGTAESFSFRSGQRVLVYATADGDMWTTQCSRTQLSDNVTRELELLRALRTGVPGGSVDGHVVTPDGANNYPGMRVVLRSASTGQPVQTVDTSGAGHFTFDWVPPGTYTLVIEGGSSFIDERKEVVVRMARTCLTLPTVILRSRAPSRE